MHTILWKQWYEFILCFHFNFYLLLYLKLELHGKLNNNLILNIYIINKSKLDISYTFYTAYTQTNTYESTVKRSIKLNNWM